MRAMIQEVEYSVWARSVERALRDKATPHVTRGAMPRFSMAFQPIVNLKDRTVYAYEGLVRSIDGQGASGVLSRVPLKTFHLFDHACRSKGLELATKLGLKEGTAALAVNVNPQAAIRENSHLSLTCQEAKDAGFPLDRLILEFVEDTEMMDPVQMRDLTAEYQAMGVRIAIDDFGAGYSGLKLLTHLSPDIVKLDMGLISRVDTDRASRVVLGAMVHACAELGVQVIAEGVERQETMEAMLDLGVYLQQGYFFARPAFESFPEIEFDRFDNGIWPK